MIKMGVGFNVNRIVFCLIIFLSVNACKKNIIIPPAAKPASDTVNLAVTKPVYRVENSLPKGYVTDGSVDYTNFIQDAINKYDNVLFPSFPLQINESGIVITNSNKILTFSPGSSLILKNATVSNYNLLVIARCSNITLNNPVIIGEKLNSISTQWSKGIAIYSASNVVINNASISNCAGDGIYIGRELSSLPSTNITINNSVCDNNYRNGITICSVNGLKLASPVCKNSNGQLPMSGIDVEPDNNSDDINNISILDAVTSNNGGAGIQLSLSNLHGAVAKSFNISVINHADSYSNTAMLISSFKNNGTDNTVSGNIDVSSPVWNCNGNISLDATWLREPSLQLVIRNPSIMGADHRLLSQTDIKTLLLGNSFDKTTKYQLLFN